MAVSYREGSMLELCCCQDSLGGSVSLLEGLSHLHATAHQAAPKTTTSTGRKCSSVLLLPLKYLGRSRMERKVLSCPKNYSGCSRDKLDLKDKWIHLGQEDAHDSLGKGQWLWQQPVWKHRGRGRAVATRASLFPHQLPHLAFCPSLPFVSPSTSLSFSASLGEWRAAALVLPGRRPLRRAQWPCWEAANHPWGSHCLHLHCQQRTGQPSLPASSATENELGRWQSVSETDLQSRQKQLHAVSVSLTDWAPPWCV